MSYVRNAAFKPIFRHLTGGLDLAAEWAGMETVGQCEFADYPFKILQKHWPDVPKWRDVRDVTVSSIRDKGITGVDIISGGFPCQPHSLAGKRLASCDERDLWGEFVRIIGEVNPRWVVGENVPGLLSSESGRFFGRVLRDLAKLGYYAGWCMYGADKNGAIHKRERVFIIAHTNSVTAFNLGERGIEGARKEEEEEWRCGWDVIELENGRVAPEKWRYKGCAPQPLLLRGGNGFSDWLDRFKCTGNAVMPQQAYPIFRAIMEIERLHIAGRGKDDD